MNNEMKDVMSQPRKYSLNVNVTKNNRQSSGDANECECSPIRFKDLNGTPVLGSQNIGSSIKPSPMLRGADEAQPQLQPQANIDNLYSIFPMDLGQTVMYNPLANAMAQHTMPIFGGMMQQHLRQQQQ